MSDKRPEWEPLPRGRQSRPYVLVAWMVAIRGCRALEFVSAVVAVHTRGRRDDPGMPGKIPGARAGMVS